ncbi:Hypothetical_protein [Hexamita inflata]|uniref:Hypothetical_protein n=1 Tax=Hexamita inflata TaxID=28002 RepID=A0AA86NT47_9EUKA|nr:Hypothetical protein HINF_LOCUS11981 [Hexamita inflata]
MSFLYVAIEDNQELYHLGITQEQQDWFKNSLSELKEGFKTDDAQIIVVENLKFCHEKNGPHYIIVTQDFVDDQEIIDVLSQLKLKYQMMKEQKKNKQWMEEAIQIILEEVEAGCECGEEECAGHCQSQKKQLKLFSNCGKKVIFVFCAALACVVIAFAKQQ